MTITEFAEVVRKDPDITVKELAKKLGLAQRTLYNRWNNSQLPKSLLNNYRLLLAKELLSKKPKKKIQEVAYELNFCDEYYFSKWFKRLTGLTPRSFRKKVLSSIEK